MNITVEKMQLAFGLDRSVAIPLEVAIRDTSFKPTKQQEKVLRNKPEYIRFIRNNNINRYNIVSILRKQPTLIKYLKLNTYFLDWALNALPHLLQYVSPDQPQYESLCDTVVKADGLCLRYVKIQTEKICMRAVKQNGMALRYCIDPSLYVQVTAVLQNLNAMDYVSPKTEEFYFEILCKYPMFWTRINDTPENRKRALGKNPLCINVMQDLDPAVIRSYIAEIDESILRYVPQSPELCKWAIETGSSSIKYIEDQTPDLQLLAIEKNPSDIKYIRKPSSDALELSVRLKPSNIEHIDQTEDLSRLAITADPKLFNKIQNPSDSLVQLALELNGMNLEYVDGQTEEFSEIAIRQNPKSFRYVLDQTPKLARLAIELNPNNVEFLFPSIIDDIVYENKYADL